MIFNINDYKGKYVMHCKTREEARDFCKYLHSIGKRWCTGDSYLVETKWKTYGENTAYSFNRGEYTDVNWYKNEGYTILEWSDFMNGKFTKEDLRTGDVVKYENGKVKIANCELKMFIGVNGWSDFDEINEDLTTTSMADGWTIVAVRRPKTKSDCQFCAFEERFGTLVYERKEVEEMTLEEVCRLLGKEIKIVK